VGVFDAEVAPSWRVELPVIAVVAGVGVRQTGVDAKALADGGEIFRQVLETTDEVHQ
jgi:hypothetical protein